MKNFIFVTAAVLILGFTSCGNKQTADKTVETETEVVDMQKAKCVEDILADAENNVGKEIVLKGFVDHTCTHSGRRCFILGKDGTTTIRVEAKGNIGGFNRELNGSEIAVKGILRESRLSKEYINQMEKEIEENKDSKDAEESCDSEMKNIQTMREWMKANNKDSYSVYFIEGLDYEVVE